MDSKPKADEERDCEESMNCPHCHKPISNSDVARAVATSGAKPGPKPKLRACPKCGMILGARAMRKHVARCTMRHTKQTTSTDRSPVREIVMEHRTHRTQEQIEAFRVEIDREMSDFTPAQRKEYTTITDAALDEMGPIGEFESRCRQAIKDIKEFEEQCLKVEAYIKR